MPIGKTEFQDGRRSNEVEDDIIQFLNERKDNAFTSQEIMAGAHFHIDFGTFETTRISTFAVADFTSLLRQMVEQGRVRAKIVEGQMFFAAAGNTGMCPKCGAEVAEPKKTWNMPGRLNKNGQRQLLHIAIFECPEHGNFRTALNRQNI